MIAGLPLAFAEPLVLLGLLSLPVLWWLLRLVPPRPRRIDFPPTRMLFDIVPKEETPSRTPWWLTLLRLTLAALVIFAAAGPLWNPPVATTTARAPLLLLIDDGFAAAATWDARMRTAEDLIARADADGRGVAAVPMSASGRDISLETPPAARARLRLVKPKPHAVERTEILPTLERLLTATPEVEIVWLSDGVDIGHAGEFVTALARLAGNAPITIVDGGIRPAHALTGADNAAGVLTVKVLRAATGGEDAGLVRGLDLKGLPLGEATYSFKSGERETDAQLDLPVEIRNDIARLEIEGERSAGAVQLLDKRWRRRTVGVVTGSTADTAQPLLASTFYLSRALTPFADVRLADRGSASEAVNQFVEQRLPMIILADVGNVVGDARDRLTRWVDDGGVLVRFAGARLAAATDDDLVPVRLRRGGRVLGGSLSWEQPQQLGTFTRESPFNGMPVPDDVTVNRQVLAEPDSGLSDHTWATLADGTPLVTAARKGKGMIVLFHVTADTRWSNLPLSGAFVDMLKRIVGLSGALTGADANAATGTTSTARRRRGAAVAHRSTASAPSGRRRRPRGRSCPHSPAAPLPTIRPASTARRKASSPSTRWRRRTACSRSTTLRSMRGSSTIAPPSRRICAARSSSPRWACSCSTPWWCSGWPAASVGCCRARAVVAGMLVACGIGLALLLALAGPRWPADRRSRPVRRTSDRRDPPRLCGDRR